MFVLLVMFFIIEEFVYIKMYIYVYIYNDQLNICTKDHLAKTFVFLFNVFYYRMPGLQLFVN